MNPSAFDSSRKQLDALLVKALMKTVLTDSPDRGLAVAAPLSVIEPLNGLRQHYVPTGRLDELAERLAADSNRPECDIVTVAHPCHRVIPSMAEYGGPLQLDSSLKALDCVWLIRVRSVFWELLDDEYHADPRRTKLDPDLQLLARMWWDLRRQLKNARVPYRRSDYGNGWNELAFSIARDGFAFTRCRHEQWEDQGLCSLSDLLASNQHPRLVEALAMLTEEDKKRFIDEWSIKGSHGLQWYAQVEVWRCKRQPENAVNSILEKRQSALSGLLAKAVRAVNSANLPLSGDKPQNQVVAGDGPIRRSVEYILETVLSRRRRVTEGGQAALSLGQQPAAWVATKSPSFALVRWLPVDSVPADMQFIDYYPPESWLPEHAQRTRMEWFLAQNREQNKGFASKYVGGLTPFTLVGFRWDNLDAHDGELRWPWILHVYFEPLLRRRNEMERRLREAETLNTLRGGAFPTDLEQKTWEVEFDGSEDEYFAHYLLWYYETILGWDLLDTTHSASHRWENGGLRSLSEALVEAFRLFSVNVAFPEKQFYALTVFEQPEVVQSPERQKLVAVSLGFTGEPLRFTDIRLLETLANTLVALRENDDTVAMQRRSRSLKSENVTYLTTGEASPGEVAEAVEMVFAPHRCTANIRELLHRLSNVAPVISADMQFETSKLKEEIEAALADVLAAAQKDQCGIGVRRGRGGRGEFEVALVLDQAGEDTFAAASAFHLKFTPLEVQFRRHPDPIVTIFLPVLSQVMQSLAPTQHWVILNPDGDWRVTEQASCKGTVLYFWAVARLLLNKCRAGACDLAPEVERWLSSGKILEPDFATASMPAQPHAVRLLGEERDFLLAAFSTNTDQGRIRETFAEDSGHEKLKKEAILWRDLFNHDWAYHESPGALERVLRLGTDLLSPASRSWQRLGSLFENAGRQACESMGAEYSHYEQISANAWAWEDREHNRRFLLDCDERAYVRAVKCRKAAVATWLYQYILNAIKHCKRSGRARAILSVVRDRSQTTEYKLLIENDWHEAPYTEGRGMVLAEEYYERSDFYSAGDKSPRIRPDPAKFTVEWTLKAYNS